MTAKILSLAAAAGLLIASSSMGLAENAPGDKGAGPKIQQTTKNKTGTETPGRLTQESGTRPATAAPLQGNTSSSNSGTN